MKKYLPSLFILAVVGVIFYSTKVHTLIYAQDETPQVASSSAISNITPVQDATAEPTLIPVPTVILNTDPLEAEDEFYATPPAQIIVDGDAPQQCSFSPFIKTIKKGSSDTFNFEAVSTDEASIIKNTFYTGDLPDGVSAIMDRAASKEGKKYDVAITVATRSQTGSFNIPVIYTETTNHNKTHTNICQFNLIIEE